jgi:hypothetical protein
MIRNTFWLNCVFGLQKQTRIWDCPVISSDLLRPHLLICLAIPILLVLNLQYHDCWGSFGLDLFLISLSQLKDYKSIWKCFSKRALSTIQHTVQRKGYIIAKLTLKKNWVKLFVKQGEEGFPELKNRFFFKRNLQRKSTFFSVVPEIY